MQKNIKQEKEKQEHAARITDNAVVAVEEEHKASRLQTLRGMRDVLPEEMPWWQEVMRAVEATAKEYRFQRLIVPMLEPAHLFERGVGAATDIVEKETYTFLDRSEERVTLRPEFTASMVRAYLEHGMHNRPQPVRVWDMGPAFRYDRPQAGRYRQFWQVDLEILGDAHPVVDAQLIAAASTLYTRLGLSCTLLINSIGDKACRPNFIRALTEYTNARASQLCDDCRRRMERNPLRVLDCKQPACRAVLADAPQIIDWLCDGCRDHFVKVLEYLDELEIPYQLEPTLVRGLDYYSRTTFEIVVPAPALEGGVRAEGDDEAGALMALGGGGRYDGLAEALGGRATPAVGFAGGIERIILALQQSGVTLETPEPPQIFIAQLGNDARKKCLRLFADLRAKGFSLAEHFAKDGLSAQLELASKLGCRHTLIVGQKELMDDTIIIRDMESGIQEIIEFKKVIYEFEKRFMRALPVHLAPPPQPVMRGGIAGDALSLPIGLAHTLAPAAVVVLQETHRIDLKREEYISRGTDAEVEAEADSEGMGHLEPADELVGVTVVERVEEEWEEEHSRTDTHKESSAGMSWASKDYADDKFDE